jgi:hypothetical protein
MLFVLACACWWVGVLVSGCRCVRVSTFAIFFNISIYIMRYEVTQFPYLQFRAIRNNNVMHARMFEVGRRELATYISEMKFCTVNDIR